MSEPAAAGSTATGAAAIDGSAVEASAGASAPTDGTAVTRVSDKHEDVKRPRASIAGHGQFPRRVTELPGRYSIVSL
jgi:type IV secretory pathway TrbL component